MSESATPDTAARNTPPRPALNFQRGAILAVSALVAVGLFGQAVFLHPLPRNPKRRTPLDYGMDYRPVELHPDEGLHDALTLRAWYVPGARPETVVLCHGRGDAIAGLLPVISLLHDLGYTALAIEFRAHGESGGTWSTGGAAEQRDLIAGLDWLDAHASAPIAAFGYSMGGGVVLSVAARDTRIRGVVTEGAVGDVPWEVHRWYGPLSTPLLAAAAPWIWLRAGVTPWDAQPVRVMDRIAPRPVLLIHSRADRMVAFAGAERLYAAADEPKEFWELHDVPHIAAVFERPEAFRRRLADFFTRVFATDT